MRIAVVGAGIAGLVVARRLHEAHDLTVFEANDYVGGHTATVEVEEHGRTLALDTGFIVFNERNYPEFTRLLRELEVPWQASDMSFSVRDESSGLECCGTSLDTLFAQRWNLVNPGFYRMLWDVRRFYREAPVAVENGYAAATLGEYLRGAKYSRSFIDRHIVPMAAAVWSAGPAAAEDIPLRFFVDFFRNHGMLSFGERPRWQVVRGGSREYVRKLIEPFRERIRLRTPVHAVRRDPEGVTLRTAAGEERFDRVVLACHSDQSLALLEDPTDAERNVLGSIGYEANDVVLHTDPSLLPRNRRAWASWNYTVESGPDGPVTTTYYMNRLQGLDARFHYCVTLNRTDRIDPGSVLRRFTYHHPVFTAETVAAQEARHRVSGVNRTHYAGAYWGYGFHEDGVRSGLAVCRELQEVPA